MPELAVRTVGTVEVSEDGRFYDIRSHAHVRMRLKRLFARSQGTAGDVSVLITDESSKDLDWFSKRYPLDFSKEAKKRMRKGARIYDKRTEATARIMLGQYTPREDDLVMAKPPRGYQVQAAELCLTTGCLLVVDELGLGKTVTAFTMLRDRRTLPAVVVAPPHLLEQWKAKFEEFLPQLRVEVAKSTRFVDFEPWPDVVIVSYFRLHGWVDGLQERVNGLIFEECQELRRYGSNGVKSRKYAMSEHLAHHAKFVMGLSATPIFNYGGEMFWVLNAMRQDILGYFPEFRREWCIDSYGEQPRLRDPATFGAYLRDNGWMVRRTREDVGQELPPLQRVTESIPADIKAIEAAKDSAIELARLILDRSADRKERFVAAGQLDSQIRHATGVAKAPYVAAFVELLLSTSDDPVLLFGWHRDVYDIWSELLEKYKPVFHTGSETGAQKANSIEKFKSGENRLLVMSLRSGSGIDGLQNICSRVVFGELDWSWGVLEQCIGRLFRPGQERPVSAYFPICSSGSDPTMVDVLGLKRGQLDGIRDADGPVLKLKEVDPDHIRKLAQSLVSSRGRTHGA